MSAQEGADAAGGQALGGEQVGTEAMPMPDHALLRVRRLLHVWNARNIPLLVM